MKKIIAFAIAASPMLALAQFAKTTGYITQIGNIISILTPIVFALALLYFFWGLAQFILSAGNEDKRKEGQHKMVWGVVALFVMATVFGLIAFLQTELGIQGAPTIVVPSI